MSIYVSPYKSLNRQLACRNVGYFLREGWEKYPQSFFLDAKTQLRYSGAECARLSHRIANSLHALGIQSGDIVALCCGNTVKTPILLSAIWSLNAVGTGLNYGHPAEEYIELAGQYQPKVFVCDGSNLQIALAVKKALTCIKHVLVIADEGRKKDSCCEFVVYFDDLILMNCLQAPEVPEEPDRLAYMPRTSGTTGRSKAVMHTHRTCTSAILMQGSEDVMISPIGTTVACTSLMHHVYALFDTYGPCVIRGFNFVHPQTHDPLELSNAIEQYSIQGLCTTPYSILTILNLFKTEHPRTKAETFLQPLEWVITASNTLPEDSILNLRRRLPHLKSFGNCYGQTEIIAAFSHVYNGGFVEPAHIGRILANGRFRVVNIDTMKDVSFNERGELWVDLDTCYVGYFGAPGTIKDSLIDGRWYRTGDICTVNEENYVKLVDRLKEFIKTKFTTISPGEVEAVLLLHPKVKDAAVLGIPHPTFQTALHALISSHSPITKAEIHEHMKENAPDTYTLEGGISFLDTIPRSSLGKLKRQELLSWVLSNSQ